MSLLEQLRSGSDSTFMQVVMALVLLSFIGWYGQPNGDQSDVVATVNGEKILDTEFTRQYRGALRMAEMRYGRTLSDAEQDQLAGDVKQGLIENEVVLQEARRLGLEVSDTEVARKLLGLEYLRNETGKFDNELYSRFLKRNSYTKADYEERLREELLMEKLRGLVFMGASTSEPALKDFYVESETRVDLKYVRVRASAFAAQVKVTPEERSAWLAENAAAVEETYQRDFDRLYNHPEQVRLRMIRLAASTDEVADMLPRLNALKAEIEAGADFSATARKWSEDPSALDGGDLGLRPIKQLASEVQSALEGVQPGQLSRVVTTEGDIRLYKLEERVAPKQDSLDEVRDAIADQLIQAEKGPALAATFAEEQLLPKWKETGVAPEELVIAQGLTVMTTGPVPAQSDGSPFSPPAEMLADARSAKPGEVLPEVYEQAGVLWVGQLTERIDADLSLYEAQRSQLREAFLMQRRIAFFQGWVEDAKARATIE